MVRRDSGAPGSACPSHDDKPGERLCRGTSLTTEAPRYREVFVLGVVSLCGVILSEGGLPLAAGVEEPLL